MKKLFFYLSFVTVISLSAFLLVNVLQTNRSITALCDEFMENVDLGDGGGGSSGGYTNGCPGGQGRRRTQAVQCDGGGWNVVSGCCWGYSQCNKMNPCNGKMFLCGVWCSAEL